MNAYEKPAAAMEPDFPRRMPVLRVHQHHVSAHERGASRRSSFSADVGDDRAWAQALYGLQHPCRSRSATDEAVAFAVPALPIVDVLRCDLLQQVLLVAFRVLLVDDEALDDAMFPLQHPTHHDQSEVLVQFWGMLGHVVLGGPPFAAVHIQMCLEMLVHCSSQIIDGGMAPRRPNQQFQYRAAQQKASHRIRVAALWQDHLPAKRNRGRGRWTWSAMRWLETRPSRTPSRRSRIGSAIAILRGTRAGPSI